MGLEFRQCSTGTIHIFDKFGQSLCEDYRKDECNPVSIEEVTEEIKDVFGNSEYRCKRIKLLSDLSIQQTLAIALVFQVLNLRICANCVRELYKNP